MQGNAQTSIGWHRNEGQQWLQLYGQGQIADRWWVLPDASYRWRGGREKSKTLLRLGIGYDIQPKLRLTAGVGYFESFQTDLKVQSEWRPYQEVTYKSPRKKGTLGFRLRVEERFNRYYEEEGASTQHDFQVRIRPRVSYALPVWKKEDSLYSLYFTVADELFINPNKLNYMSTLQNRFMLGPELRMGNELKLNMTYNAQVAGTTMDAEYRYTNVLWLRATYRFDLRKK
ncbi:hypothetical protein GCM10023331_00650 [Algivirga pacifica]|uniref:DUF2490 domain-containing protein n=2 Tax=Algivirga pacifica TaxID=1162670 RepID=A0ABP9CV99_9BACT